MKRLLPFLIGLALWGGAGANASAETPLPGGVPSQAAAADPETQDMVRAYLQLQEQLHAAQLAIERSRLEAETVASSNAANLTIKLRGIEKTMTEQSAREMRIILGLAGVIAGFGFLAVFLVSYLQLRAMRRFTEAALSSSASQLNQIVAGSSAQRLLGSGAAEANAKLSGTIERLEKRIRELEVRPAAISAPAAVTASAAPANSNPPNSVAALLLQGQERLEAGQIGEAVASFDAALAIEPSHVEALIKKGTALEKLAKPDEAVACYDRAIAVDSTVTIAYLYKGGVFNRLERYNEALECYEQALKTQEKSHAA